MKRRKEHVIDELSAYLDGEYADPGRVEQHLEMCPQCAHRYKQLVQLSERLHSLPHREPRAGFAARVMARLDELERPRTAHRLRWLVPAGSAVTVAALAFVISLGLTRISRENDVQRGASRDNATVAVSMPDESLLMGALEQKLAQENGTWDIEPETIDWAWAGQEVEDEQWVEALSASSWFEPVADAYEQMASVDTLIDQLTDDEEAAFREVLKEYVEQDYST